MKLTEISVDDRPTASKWQTFKKMCQMLNTPPVFRNIDFDGDEVIEDAIKIMRERLVDVNNANNIAYTLNNIKKDIISKPGPRRIAADTDALIEHFGFAPAGWVKETFDANKAVAQKSKAIHDHIDATLEVYEVLMLAATTFDGKTGNDEWKSHGRIVQATFRKLGIL